MTSIAVLTTGGTIASRHDSRGAAVATDAGAQLIQALPPLPSDVSLTVHDVVSADSSALTLPQLDAIRRAVTEALRSPDVDGVVVTHGTDTMEETSLLVDLSHDDPRPVVFTGAQLSADAANSDGPTNLADAIAVAANPSMRNRGALLSFAGTVRTVRGMSKVNTAAAQPFSGSPVDAGNAATRTILPANEIAGYRVDVIASFPGADATLLHASLDAGADGIVLVGTGSGNTTAAMMSGVRQAISRQIPVVVTSRVGEGPIAAEYGGGSGARDLIDAGAIVSANLRAGQCRIALLALLASGANADAVRTFFA